MKRKKKLLIILLVLISLAALEIFIIKKTGAYSSTTVAGEIRDINNNTLTFKSGFLHNYFHIMLENTRSKNLEEGLEFDVINPKGQKVTSGRLYEDKIFRERYKNIPGEWKIILHFKDKDSSSMLNYGYSTNSKKESTMRISD